MLTRLCGVLAENLAGISIATSFVGMFAAAMAVGEIVRGVNGGERVLSLATHLRSQPVGIRAASGAEIYALRFARNGIRGAIAPPLPERGDGDLMLAR